jgi:very-short-patch-repair endonuclease
VPLISKIYGSTSLNPFAARNAKSRKKQRRRQFFISLAVPGNHGVTDRKLAFASKMCSCPTPSERALYRALKQFQVKKQGITFRSQVVMYGYIADVWCGRYRLVIEVDGSIHQTPAQRDHDRHRNEVMQAKGLHVLRVNADWVMSNPKAAAQQVNEYMQRLPLWSKYGPKRKQEPGKLQQWGRDGKPLMFVNAESAAFFTLSDGKAADTGVAQVSLL